MLLVFHFDLTLDHK